MTQTASQPSYKIGLTMGSLAISRTWPMPFLLSLFACLPSYDPPPELAEINIEQGLYDPNQGPLQLTFTEPVVLKSIEATLYLGRTDMDLRLCRPDTDGTLAPSCTEEASTIVGPCRADLAKAIRENQTTNRRLLFQCEGGEISLNAINQVLSLSALVGLAPFETYRVVVSAGLEDEGGQSRKVPIEVSFQVKSNIPCEPTTFQSGFFFSTFDIEAPARGQYHFLFWVQVDADTGQTRLYGSRLRPNTGIDPISNRNFADWRIDSDPKTGSYIFATGQTARIAGDVVFTVHPFTLKVNQPKINAPGVELSGQVKTSIVAGASDDQRDVIRGRLTGPAIFLGEGASAADLGPGHGTATLFRLLASEAPHFEDGIPPFSKISEIQADFEACD